MHGLQDTDLSSAILMKISAAGGLKVRRGKTFMSNLSSALKIDGVNRRLVHAELRELLRTQRVRQEYSEERINRGQGVIRYVTYFAT